MPKDKTIHILIKPDGSTRLGGSQRLRIGEDEVAIQVNLHFPKSWGRTIATIDIDLPDTAPEVHYRGDNQL